MTAKDYIATVRLSTKSNETLAMPGETCERVPVDSLTWLSAQGLIVERERAPDVPDVEDA